jgi:MFS family permease
MHLAPADLQSIPRPSEAFGSWMVINGAYIVLISFGPALLVEQGRGAVDSAIVVSVVSWAFLVGLPSGGFLASKYSVPNLVMVCGLSLTILAGAAIPFTDAAGITFPLFGLCYAMAAPVVGSLPAEAVLPENWGPGLGIFQVGNFVGSAVFPVVAGELLDSVGSAAGPVLLATALMLATLVLLGIFRLEQRRLPLLHPG